MTFRKGEVTNPRGRPKKEKVFSRALLQSLKYKFGSEAKGLAKCADSLIEIALDVNNTARVHAIKEIRDSIDGKPVQTLSSDADNPVFPSSITLEIIDKSS
jgi:hypothetical protein